MISINTITFLSNASINSAPRSSPNNIHTFRRLVIILRDIGMRNEYSPGRAVSSGISRRECCAKAITDYRTQAVSVVVYEVMGFYGGVRRRAAKAAAEIFRVRGPFLSIRSSRIAALLHYGRSPRKDGWLLVWQSPPPQPRRRWWRDRRPPAGQATLPIWPTMAANFPPDFFLDVRGLRR